MPLYPIPTTRSSDSLARTRLLSQLQADSLSLLRLQTQLSTGLRLQAPSDDPNSALRAQGIQRLLELKAQAKSNLATSQSFLGATDNALSGIATLLTNARALTVESAGSTTSADQRREAAAEVGRIVDRLIEAGNQEFRGRYLFSGSRTNQVPFEIVGDQIAFNGNLGSLESYADTDFLFQANIDANTVFGAVSAEQRGTVDLNPILTENTRLANINAGRGVSRGSITISDGINSSTIDLSSAETIGDVAALLEEHPPAGRSIIARVGPRGLSVEMDAAGGGNLTISEVSAGTTAAELGIRSNTALGTGPIVGSDLDPILLPTSPLADALGVNASAIVASSGTNNDLIIESLTQGAAENGVTVQFVEDSLWRAAAGLNAGSETVSWSATALPARAGIIFSGAHNNLRLTASTAGTAFNNVQIVVDNAGAIGNNATVSFDAGNKILHLGIDSTGATQVQTLINQINAEGTFTAAHDPSNPPDGSFVPTATIPAADIGITRNTSNSGAEANTFLVAIDTGFTTANHVVAALNNNATFSSRFSARLDDKDTSSFSAAGKGAIDVNAEAVTSGGSGVQLDLTSGLQIRNGGQTFTIDTSSAETVEDLLNLLNGSGANVLADINPSGTGIDIRSRLSGSDLSIGENGGTTATQLGIRSLTEDTRLATLNYGQGVTPSGGVDFTIHRNDGVDLEIDLSSADTIGDVLDLINNHPANLNPATRVAARLAQFGNGIELVDDTPLPGNTLSIEQAFGSHAAEQLGLMPRGATTSTSTISGTAEQLTGSDPNPIEVAGVFTSLIRLRQALANNDLPGLERASGLLDQAFENLNFARADIGARGQSLDLLETRLDDEEIELKDTLSNEIEIDFAEAVSNLTARQAAFQASLQLSAQLSQLTLLNFL